MCRFELTKKVVKAVKNGHAVTLRLDVFPVKGKDAGLMSHMTKLIKNTFSDDRILFTDMDDKHTSCFIWLSLDEIEKLAELASSKKSLFDLSPDNKESEEETEKEKEEKPVFH